MTIAELFNAIQRGEDSLHQFKMNITSADALAADMTAFSNGAGGRMIIGVDDDGHIAGLSADDVRRLNMLISNAASQNVKPAINPTTENIMTDKGLVMLVDIPSGINKPYQDKNGIFWVKSGSDKRKATSREEIQRMFHKANLIHADELTVRGATEADLDLDYFKMFFQRRFNRSIENEKMPLAKILENMRLMADGLLTISGVLLFTEAPCFKLPAFIVKAGAFDSTSISTTNYADNRDITGKLEDVYRQTVYFILSNLRHQQGGQGFNGKGIPEIPHEAIEELVANALIHRDYFVSASIRVFIFRDRVEIISPGCLPNSLTVDNIKSGASIIRNPILASYAYNLLPYNGYGSGIIRALEKYPHIDFLDDKELNTFKVTMKRTLI